MLDVGFISPNFEEIPHRRVHHNFQVFKNFLINELFKLSFVAGLVHAVLCLLPEVPRNIIFVETLTVEHQHLEEVFDAET